MVVKAATSFMLRCN